MKKIVGLFLLFVLMFTLSVGLVAQADDAICVTLDGSYIEFDVQPQIINGRTMVPIRAIFEKMGATVDWEASTNTAICTKGATVVTMTVDSMDMYINGEKRVMDIAPVVIDGRTLAPARYVAEAFGADVQWNEAISTVVIQTKVTLYALDGRTISVFKVAVPEYTSVGWYETLEETQQTLYAADGRTITVFKAAVPEYTSVGWYETWEEAQAAYEATKEPDTQYNPSADGYYYRTPTGKRYHLDPNCGGKNSYRTTNINGLTPCSKCAK